MKIAHSADWHLRDKDIEEAEKCLETLVTTADDEAVDLIVIAGDVFDSQDIKLDSKAAKMAVRTVSRLADIAPVAIVIGTPSHDGMAPEILSFARGRNEIEVASKPEQAIMGGALLTLIPQPTKQYFNSVSGIRQTDQEISQAMSALFMGFGAQAAEHDGPHILVGHWSVSGAVLSTGQTLTGHDIEISVEQMEMAKSDLICLGHIHKSQQLGGHSFYSGSIYRNNWGEMEDKGFFIHEIDQEPDPAWRNKPKSRFIETPTKKLVRLTENFIDSTESGDRSRESIDGAHVRLDITVYQDEAATIDKGHIEAAYLGLGAIDVDIRIARIPRETVRAESVLKVDRLADKIREMARLRGEDVNGNTFNKCDMLEDLQPDEIIQKLTGVAA